jgi:hypothetical protein
MEDKYYNKYLKYKKKYLELTDTGGNPSFFGIEFGTPVKEELQTIPIKSRNNKEYIKEKAQNIEFNEGFEFISDELKKDFKLY